MDLGQLEAFVAICRSGSFHAAARALHLSQPAITSRIRALEYAAGADLLIRKRGHVAPTDAGRALLPHARAALDAVAEAHRAVGGARESGTVRLAVSVNAGAYLLPELLRSFWARHTLIEVDVRVCPAAEVASRVLDGEAQIGLTRPAPEQSGLVLHRFPDDPVRLVVPPDHPFASHPSVTSAEVAAEQRLIVSSDKAYWEDLRAQFARAGAAVHPVLDAGLLEVSKQLVTAGIGVAFLPELLVREELRTGRLVAVPVADLELPVVSAAILRAEGRDLPAPAAALWEVATGDEVTLLVA
ncbi:MAG: hypothetical protein AVDCRST_MAG77-5963 [uncultured Chloroflexi bacterium]|uniref:HTH lysR-type domain-containing protein n=1 Tax=uncultured Chloroflexota bacterium TaxID=166587 RepID=A0A6J4KBM4_9CHLR|nr:MAG: hypothetical protein AVDCRST_MAG77-5963 [uncultured Chloroflexota bacterium]